MIKKIQKSLLILLIGLVFAIVLFCVAAFAGRMVSIRSNILFFRNSLEFGTYDAESGTVKISLPIEKEFILNYESDFAAGGAHFYRDQYPVSGSVETKAIYQAVLYAMDHNYSYINVSADGITKEAIQKAVQFAILDQPMLEENSGLILEYNEINYSGEVLPRYEMILPTNDAIHLEYKKRAFQEAKSWVAAIPAGASDDKSKAFWLYSKLVQSTRYTGDSSYNEKHPHYLYDALINGSTNCDGFSNAYSLLLNLAGIESINVIRFSEETQVGHSWNLLRIGEKYYQADPTIESDLFGQIDRCLGLYFCRSSFSFGEGGYSDIIADIVPDCDDRRFDSEGIDLTVQERELSFAERQNLSMLMDEMEKGKSLAVISSVLFSDYSAEDVLETVKEWLAPYSLNLKLITDGEKYCFLLLI